MAALWYSIDGMEEVQEEVDIVGEQEVALVAADIVPVAAAVDMIEAVQVEGDTSLSCQLRLPQSFEKVVQS